MRLSMDWMYGICAAGACLTFKAIPSFKDKFIDSHIYGIDMSKRSKEIKVPEATGVITGCIFLIMTFLMIPVTFQDHLMHDVSDFPHDEFVQLVSALLSISCMLLLGFADDVLNLKWRHKLLLPSAASLPLLMVYYVTANRTEIVVPLLLRPWLGSSINLGILYYVYMGMLAVFCTNAINILAGINGLEVGQSVIIAGSVAVFNLREMEGALGHYHHLSLYFLLPYLATSIPLLYFNWYPSTVFPGDTFCYFSGMTLAVVAILGHFSKTLLLFFIPQIVNFLYSTPQLFRIIPCPRHRLPKYDIESDSVGMSMAIFQSSEVSLPGRLVLWILKSLRVAHVKEYFNEKGVSMVECNNLTLINLMLKVFGPMHEKHLTILLLAIQVICSLVAFAIRYPLALLLFGEVVA